MPTGETAELAGGRVTRSLRKRLTSIDSDASSRPGTPNLATLQTIPETNTPTKRLTRRASLSTPAPATPSKETTNTPGRRVNRRRSINYSDSEDNAIPVQPIAKEPTIAVVKEEPESPKGRAKRVLRSSSKSPNESENNTTKSKRGRKKIIKEKEPETTVPDNTTEEESVKAHSFQKKTRVTIKKETVVEVEIKKIKQKTPNKSDLTLEQAEDDNKSPMKSPTKRGSLLTQTTPDSKKCLSAQKERRISESIIASQSQSPSQKIRCFSLSQLSQPLAQSTQKSPPKKNNPEPLKSVLFTASDDENDEKTVYPKTPGLAKSESYILDGSNNVDKDDTFKSSKKDHSEAGSFDDDNDKEIGEETAVLDTKTPHKLKLLGGVESSTPIQQKNSPQKNPKSVEILAKDIAAKEYVFSDDDDDDDKQQISSFQKSFSQSYSKKAGNTPKVDPVVQETSIAEKKTEGVANKSQSNTPSSNIKNKSNQGKTLDSDLSGDEIDHLVQNVSGTAENKSAVQNAKLLYSPKPPLAVQESTSIQPKMKSEETGLKNPAKEYVFSDDDDDEDEKQKDTSSHKSSNTSVSETKKADKATTNTPKKSSPKKCPLSKAQCSDSSEEDDHDVVEKGDKKEDKSISKSLISTSTKSPNKSFMKTPTKSPNKKSRLSKAQCSDSSEDDGEVIEKDNKKEQNEMATPTPKIPNKAKSLATDKSTPTMQNKSPEKKRKSIEIQQTDVIGSADEGNDDEKQKVVEFPTSWNTGVSGTKTEISKLDCITPQKSMSKAEDAEDQSKAQNNISVEKHVGRQTINSDTSDDDIDRREAGYEFDEDEEEDENREKSMYIDDEAMEVPPGEESSYSEDENALPEYGESIGSQDSPDEDIDDVDGDDEPDEDDEAFIVSDTEPVEGLISSEEEEPENLKKYKRIYQASQSSDDEVELKSEPNAKDKSLKDQSKMEKTETIQSPKKEDVVAKPQTAKKYNRIHRAPESSGDEEVQMSANATSPNKDETDICLLVDSTFEDDKDDDVKVSMDTKTLDKSLKEDSKIEKKELPRRSTRKSNNSKSDSDNNKLNKTVQDMDSNSDSGLKEEEVDRSNPIVLEQIIILPIGIEQEQKLTKSPSKRRSAAIISINNDESEVDNMDDEDQKSINEPRKSLPATNKKSPSKKSRKSIIAVSLDSSDEEDIASDVKALSQSQAEEESEATGKSRKSRKSLIRTSTEETNKSEDENNLEKTTFELEGEESEPEETQAASKAKKRSMNKSGDKEDLNTSGRRSRNVSLHEEFETATKSRKSSFNESRKSLVRTSTEETNENEETLSAHETSKKLLDNQDSNEVETKSQRRKSIVAQQSVSLQDSENTADSEKGKQQKPPQPATNKKSPSKKSRKSIIAVSLDSSDEEDIASDVKALSQSQAEEESEATGKSRKSRKSLIRTSTEETNKSEDENNLEKTTFELEGEESEPEETQAASKAKKRSMNKSGDKEDLNTSGRRSRNVSLHEEFETATKSRKSSFNESRKSLVRTSTEETNENEETLSAHETSKKLLDNQDSNEVETKSQRRKSIVAQQSVSLQDSENTADSEKGKQQKPPQPATNKKSPSKKSRKSIIAVSLDSSDEEDIASDVKALSQSQAEEESEATGKSRKSRKSLIRTSTEETNKSEDENNLEKTTFELEGEESEPEETQAASKAKKRSMNKSGDKEDLNTSGRRSRNVSLHEEFETATKSRKSSFNESRKSLVRTSTEETNENEETLPAHETSKKLLDNQDSNEVETKSQRRKSIVAQQSVSLQDSENTADSEKGKQQKPPQRRKSISQPAPHSSDAEEDDEEGEEKENNSSPEATDTEMENSRNDPAEAQFSDGEDDDEKTAANQTVSSFLGEKAVKQNASRRKSIAATESSKLDETFQLDPKNSLSSTLHESLHRNVLKKNLNQKRRQTIEVTTKSNDSSDSDDEDNSSAVEGELEIKKKVISEKGLSVSLNSIKIKKKKLKERKEIRNSFTIGVSLRMNSSEDESSPSKSEPEEADRALENGAASSENEQVSSDEGDEGGNEDSSESEGKLLNDSEEEVLEKVKNVESVVPPKSRKSLSILAPPPSDTGDVKPKKAIKRTSLYLQEDAASSSFVENLAEEKKKIKQQKRKSNSFCGVVKPPSEDNDDFVQRPPEPRSEKKLKKSSESSEANNKEVNVSKVLSRCEQMLEAANEAKRLAKMQAKKVKVKKPKWMDKDEKATAKEEDQVTIPLVSKKEIKRKEKLKKELEKALKHSAAVLTKAADPALKNKQKNVSAKPTTKIASPSKRLDDDFLESLIQLSNPSKKKTKAIETTPPSDKENSKKKSQKQKYKIEDVHTQIQSDIETLETACGTVIVEPSTPKKLRIQHGFRESPKTPRGYKIQDITTLSNKKSNHKTDQRKFKTSSGAFIEEDVETSKKNKDKKRKRKLPFIEEPSHTLPKTQWTRSGVFYEEDLAYPCPLANSTATQFLVASLNSSKKNKPAALTVSATTMNKALDFKNKAIKDKKVNRVSSREVLFAKQRSAINKKF